MSIADEFLQGATATVELSGLPTLRFDLSGAGQEGPGLLLSLLKPRVTVKRGNLVLFATAPAGRPEDGLPLGLMALLLVALIAGYFVFRK